MKLDTIRLIRLLTILLCFAGGTIAWAAIPQQGIRCQGCHVTPGEGELQSQYAGNDGCINCHSSSDSSTTYELDLGGGMGQTVTVPVVYYTGDSPPSTYLAGGNFYSVSGGGTESDPKGHNVGGIAGEDSNLTIVPGQQIGGNDQLSIADCLGCHIPFLSGPGIPFDEERVGNILICEDCHVPRHHADDSGVVVDGAGGWYRFLYEVTGIEDSDWQATTASDDHNEYQGETTAFQYSVSDKGCACHSQWHALRNPGGVGTSPFWLMHPSDVILPSDPDKEYCLYTVYNPQAPVARPDLSGYVGPRSTVTPGTDQVMCLSCHRAHGSPYPKMLRWDLNGCKTCHTSK